MAHLTTSLPAIYLSKTVEKIPSNFSECVFTTNEWIFSVIPPYIMTVSILGILLNSFVLMVFSLHKKSCTMTEIHLSNLAAADLLLVSFLPFYAVYVFNHFNWTFGLAMCKFVNLSILMNTYCSIYFMVLVSIDRYLALVHPMFYERISEKKFAKLGCMVVWILGFIFGLPALIHRDLKPSYNQTFCYLNFPSRTTQLISDTSISLFGFITPIFIISFCTFKIIKALRSGSKEIKSAEKMHQKMTTLVLAVLLAFLICWVPYHLLKLLYLLKDADMLTSCSVFNHLLICSQIFTYLAFFNSTLNPILYCLVGKTFQKKVKELFKLSNQKSNMAINDPSTSTKLYGSAQSEENAL
ncbi:B2 bradykinin receptor [Nothobranchius furzeri]|uniref:B2 bradykinin receptor-like n=1 Tax=Nothobranchius furzeri TaxID=105023 RepID=A0A9D2XGG8_NOTFU|nr:B2 bradykinin receptor [Nothobranchius furzeri]KAF7201615.1 B2 bradykinin receptor-like [Nothobranchius furzeri]